jgi:hypothetical protein
MKQMSSKIGAVLMGLLLLFSTTSFTLQLRYCTSDLVETALFSKADSCSIEEDKDCCLSANDCCNVEQIVIVKQLELIPTSAINFHLKKQNYAVNWSVFYLNNFESLTKSKFLKKEYIPPNIFVNRHLINQVYLI